MLLHKHTVTLLLHTHSFPIIITHTHTHTLSLYYTLVLYILQRQHTHIMRGNTIHISLQDNRNITYKGVFHIHHGPYLTTTIPSETAALTTLASAYDGEGALYYVCAVLVLYSMSMALIIASYVRRRGLKMKEDKHISTYINEFQIVKDKHRRHHYKMMKKGIINYLHFDETIRSSVVKTTTFSTSTPTKLNPHQKRRLSFAGYSKNGDMASRPYTPAIGQGRLMRKYSLQSPSIGEEEDEEPCGVTGSKCRTTAAEWLSPHVPFISVTGEDGKVSLDQGCNEEVEQPQVVTY